MIKSLLILFIFCVIIILPFLLNDVLISLVITFIIFSSLALSLDLILGKTGILSMGHIMYFGIGAYTFAILLNHFNLNVLIAFVLSGVVAFIISLLVTKPIIHLTGDYFLIVTIALNIIFIELINNDFLGLTGGPNGIFGLTKSGLWLLNLQSDKVIYFIALLLLLIVIMISHNMNYSKIGKALFLINEDEIAAKGMGINVPLLKLFICAFGAAIAGICGALYVLQNDSVVPSSFDVTNSILLFAVVIVGGRGSIIGVIIGTFIMYVLPEIFRWLNDYRFLFFGITLVILMIVRPSGIIANKFSFYKIKYLKNE